jgi:hypothetical protein
MKTIPNDLYEELIEYFDNKSDADGDSQGRTPNKEMQLLGRLREVGEVKITESKIPKDVFEELQARAIKDARYGLFMGANSIQLLNAMVFAYNLASSEIDSLKQEIDRLKKIIEQQFKYKYAGSVIPNRIRDAEWDLFKFQEKL